MAEKMDLIWESKLDDAYQCEVARTGPSTGQLTVTGPDGARLLDEPVTLAYGAQFGPDIDDVADWQARCTEVVDGVP